MVYDYQPPKVEHVQYVIKEESIKKGTEEIKNEVRDAYGRVAQASHQNQSCGNGRSCCGVTPKPDSSYSKELGYSQEEFESVPEGTNMGLGCGNPQAIANLKRGEVVLDLGAGGGFDAFLAAQKVGSSGMVYGVDMTPEMLSTARAMAVKGGYTNVEFLLGEIEHLPLPDQTVDVIISNCVINLSTNKEQVFKESFRVLKEGGRLAISDMVAYRPLPPEMVSNKELYCNCISGAIPIDELKQILAKSGFTDIVIETQQESRMFIKDWVPGSDSENYVISAKIQATKPKVSTKS